MVTLSMDIDTGSKAIQEVIIKKKSHQGVVMWTQLPALHA